MAEGNENSLLPEVVTVVSEEEGILQRLHNHQVAAGKVGGSSRSDKKRLAVKENLKKARAKRWPGREASYSLVAMEAVNGSQQAKEEAPSLLQPSDPRRDGVLPQNPSEPDRES